MKIDQACRWCKILPNIARGTTDPGYWVRNLSNLSAKIVPNWFSSKYYSSYRLNTLGPLCLWQCFKKELGSGDYLAAAPVVKPRKRNSKKCFLGHPSGQLRLLYMIMVLMVKIMLQYASKVFKQYLRLCRIWLFKHPLFKYLPAISGQGRN